MRGPHGPFAGGDGGAEDGGWRGGRPVGDRAGGGEGPGGKHREPPAAEPAPRLAPGRERDAERGPDARPATRPDDQDSVHDAVQDAAKSPGQSSEQSPGQSPEQDVPGARQPADEQFDHRLLKSLLGAWALAACSPEETAAVEVHLNDCGPCADEALRLRDAVGLLHPEDSLDLDPALRSRVLKGCMVRRAPRIPVPDWAAPYDAESSRLDALLRDMAGAEWLAPVLLRWFDGRRQAERETTVGGVIGHLLAVDGVVATSLGLPDPLDARAARAVAESAGGEPAPADGTFTGPAPAGGTPAAPAVPATGSGSDATTSALASRTEECWRSGGDVRRTPAAREPWREQGRAMVRTVSFAGSGVAGLDVDYGDFTLPVRDAMLDRAFECWMHAEDIADAIDYPYTAPQGEHMHHMVDLAARLLPGTIAWRRRTGLAGAPRRLTTAGAPGRALHLEVEGDGGGDWYIPLDSPAAAVRPEDAVAHVALDRYEFCQLVAGHVPPLDTAAGQDGDREAVRDVLFAAASLSRM